MRRVESGIRVELDKVSPGWWASVKVLETERDAHNRWMHSYNGNPVVVNSMEEIKTLPKLDDYGHDQKTDNRFNGAIAELAVNTTKNGTNPNNATQATRAVMRCRTQNAAGALQDRQDLEPLENYMIPRQVWDAGPLNVVASPYGLSWVHFSAFNVTGLPMEDTPFWLQVGKSELEDNFQLGRTDNISPNGFRSFDVKELGKAAPIYGLEMSTFALKLKLWHTTLMWQPGNTAYLPLSNDLGRFDPRMVTQPDNQLYPLSVNDGPIATENWGGDANVFPMCEGQTGTLTFHICLDSVPEQHKSTVIVMPRIFASIFPNNPAKAIAIFVACLAPWPFCNYFVRRDVANSVNANLANVRCLPFSCAVKVDGILDLHILLPRQGTGAVPGSPADAATRALVRPIYGPNASALYPAGGAIGIAYVAVGAPAFQIDLAQYLYTWALGVSYIDLALFSSQMYRLGDMSAWFNLAEDRVASTCVRYSPMTTNVAPVISSATHAQLLPDGRRIHM